MLSGKENLQQASQYREGVDHGVADLEWREKYKKMKRRHQKLAIIFE
jgi:hypothetical protein